MHIQIRHKGESAADAAMIELWSDDEDVSKIFIKSWKLSAESPIVDVDLSGDRVRRWSRLRRGQGCESERPCRPGRNLGSRTAGGNQHRSGQPPEASHLHPRDRTHRSLAGEGLPPDRQRVSTRPVGVEPHSSRCGQLR